MNIAQVDLNLLKTFEALHDESSASRAALRLGVTQSAISLRIQRLEDSLGKQLFTRSKAGAAGQADGADSGRHAEVLRAVGCPVP